MCFFQVVVVKCMIALISFTTTMSHSWCQDISGPLGRLFLTMNTRKTELQIVIIRAEHF